MISLSNDPYQNAAEALLQRFSELKLAAEQEPSQYTTLGPLEEMQEIEIIEPAEVSLPFQEQFEMEIMPPELTTINSPNCISVCLPTATDNMTCTQLCVTETAILDRVDVPPIAIVIPEEFLTGFTRLNGKIYETGQLVDYLYSTDPNKTIPDSNISLSKIQASNIISLIARGFPNIVASLDTESAYAVDENVVLSLPSDIILFDKWAKDLMFTEKETKIAIEKNLDYYVNAFKAYAIELGMALGTDWKPAINFGIARYLNLSGSEVQPYVMGKDIDIIGMILEWEANGLERIPENLDEVRRRLTDYFGITEREADLYAVPWAYGMCCALNYKEMEIVKTCNQDAINDLKKRLQSEELNRRPLAAYLSDNEYELRLRNIDVDLLSSQAESIPIEGENIRNVDPDSKYIIYASTLTTGAPLSPPMKHSLGEKTHRLIQHTTTPSDVFAKELGIYFINDCQM